MSRRQTVRKCSNTITKPISQSSLPRQIEQHGYTVVDLFSGAGGMTCGFWEKGFTLKGAADKQEGKPGEHVPCNETYRMNFGIEPLNVDLGNYDPKELLTEFSLKEGELTVLISCPPCTGYSQKRPNYKGEADQQRDKEQADSLNRLVAVTANYVKAFDPEFLIMENVPEMLTGPGKGYFKELYVRLRELSYSVFVHTFDFAYFGLPQHRKRVLLLARRNNDNLPDLRARILRENNRTVEMALGQFRLPPLYNGGSDPLDRAHSCPNIGGRNPRVLQRCKLIRDLGGGRWAGLNQEALSEDQWDSLTKRMQKALKKGDRGTFPDCYGTVLPDQRSRTIIRQCGDIGTGAWFHWKEDRMLSAREMAILQGFPYYPREDGQSFFRFAGSTSRIYQQIGNAVPPLVSRIIAEEILNVLTGRKPGLSPEQFPPVDIADAPLSSGDSKQLIAIC